MSVSKSSQESTLNNVGDITQGIWRPWDLHLSFQMAFVTSLVPHLCPGTLVTAGRHSVTSQLGSPLEAGSRNSFVASSLPELGSLLFQAEDGRRPHRTEMEQRKKEARPSEKRPFSLCPSSCEYCQILLSFVTIDLGKPHGK